MLKTKMGKSDSTCVMCQGHLYGVVLCENGILAAGLKLEAITWSYAIRKAIALCNDLMPLNGRKIVGPDSEKRAFADVEAAFVVCADPSPSPHLPLPPLARYAFVLCSKMRAVFSVNCPQPPSPTQLLQNLLPTLLAPLLPSPPAAYDMCCPCPPPLWIPTALISLHHVSVLLSVA